MTSLRSGVKLTLMKKLSLYVFLLLMFCNVGFAEKISFIDIKIGDKITDHFSSDQINKYYFFDKEKTPKGEILYGRDKKYSYLEIGIEDKIFKEKYNYVHLYYENNTKKIVALGGGDYHSSLNDCLKSRKNLVSKYKQKNRITSLFNEQENENIFPDGTKDYNITFYGKTLFAFHCQVLLDGRVVNQIALYEHDYNDYIFEKWNEE